jgi:hypothetical protein
MFAKVAGKIDKGIVFRHIHIEGTNQALASSTEPEVSAVATTLR